MLWINDSNADNDEIQAGVDAANGYFDRIGWRPSLVRRVAMDDESPEQDRARDIWSEAEAIAFTAAFRAWSAWPEAACLVWYEPAI